MEYLSNYALMFFYILILFSLSFVFVKNSLHMFQQNHYELIRYSKWLFDVKNVKASIVYVYILLVLVLNFLVTNELYKQLVLLAITFIISIYLIDAEDKKVYIKKLVVTNRVKRQIVVVIILMSIFFCLSLSYLGLAYTLVLSIISSYLIIYPLGLITIPIEGLIKKHYENDAKRILNGQNNLIKVGITGSFGKTSTKNIIYDIICRNYLSLKTPASYNTPMGITKTIRELLKPIHQVFICEMGADKVNDISYLMKFVEPQFGIVTSIGPQHLNTFGNIDNIIKEKMKEIEMLPSNGVGIVNYDIDYIRNYHLNNNCKLIKVGIKNSDVDYYGENIKYSSEGSKFIVKINNKKYKFETSLLGEHNVTNILIGIALAVELKIDIKDIIKSVKNIKQVEHRLEIKKINGYTFIDDAFNSNPVGCKMACDVLKMMPGKRVMVTPGLIDLGSKQDEYNKEFGIYMSDKTDFIILVNEKQTKPIYDGLLSVNYKKDKVLVVNSINEAFNYIYSHFSQNDTFLLENDLPDAFAK